MSFLFGSVFALNVSGLGFFFFYPRLIHITIIDPWIDLLVWVASTFCAGALTIWRSKDQLHLSVEPVLMVSSMILAILLFATLQNDLLYRVDVYLLFAIIALGLVAAIAWSRPLRNRSMSLPVPLVLVYVLAMLTVVETASLTHDVIRAFDLNTQVGSMDAGIELQLSYASYGLLPWLYLAFLFSWVWVPLVQRAFPRNPFLKTQRNEVPDRQEGLVAHDSSGTHLSRLLDPKLYLALAFAFFVGYYPYFENPPWLVGTDAYWRYYDPLLRMNAKGVWGGFVQALHERHPVPLMLLYGTQLVSHVTSFDVVRVAQVLLVVTLAGSTYWFLARKKGASFGLTVFLLSALSVTTMVGLYSSILANWMVLVGWVAFLAYIGFRSDETFRIQDFAVLFGLSTLILLLHPWTWGVFAATVVTASILALIQDRRKGLRSSGMLLAIISVDLVFAFLSITLLAGSQGWRVVDAIDLYTYVIQNPATVLYFWAALTRLTEIWAPFFSPLYIAVSILGVFCLKTSNLTKSRLRFIYAWLCVAAIGSILVAPVGFDPARPTETESQLWRLLFLTPFQLTVPFGIAWLAKLPRQLGLSPNPQGKVSTRWNSGLFSVIILIVLGTVLAWTPAIFRPVLLLICVPIATAPILLRGHQGDSAEREFLGAIVLVCFLLVALNSTLRGLSQLLIDPHNYRT